MHGIIEKKYTKKPFQVSNFPLILYAKSLFGLIGHEELSDPRVDAVIIYYNLIAQYWLIQGT